MHLTKLYGKIAAFPILNMQSSREEILHQNNMYCILFRHYNNAIEEGTVREFYRALSELKTPPKTTGKGEAAAFTNDNVFKISRKPFPETAVDYNALMKQRLAEQLNGGVFNNYIDNSDGKETPIFKESDPVTNDTSNNLIVGEDGPIEVDYNNALKNAIREYENHMVFGKPDTFSVDIVKDTGGKSGTLRLDDLDDDAIIKEAIESFKNRKNYFTGEAVEQTEEETDSDE